MEYYLKINEHEYLIPSAVASVNKEIFLGYSNVIDGKNYFEFSRLIMDGRKEDALRIYTQCISSVGMIALDMEEDYLDLFNKFGPLLKSSDVVINNYFKSGEDNKAYEKMLLVLDEVLGFFDKMLKDDEIIKPKSR